MTPEQAALVALGQALQRSGYEFVTVTPETHRRVNARAERSGRASARSLRDIFGWNRAFEPERLPESMLAQLRAADALEPFGERLRSRVRFSTLGRRLFAHSAFPTGEADSVFFGPDTYRFCALLQRWAAPARRAIDIGCGSGAGGISISDRAQECLLVDVNERALRLSEVNAALAGLHPECVVSDVLDGVTGEFDLIIANPPYMRDEAGRVYRDGGGEHGEQLGIRIVQEALPRLAAGGRLIVYTGSAVVDGVDTFARALAPHLRADSLAVDYEELDPDVFGEELDNAGYAQVDRIAAVGLSVCVR